MSRIEFAKKALIGIANPLFEFDFWCPARGSKQRGVGQFSRGSIGACWVGKNCSGEANCFCHQGCKRQNAVVQAGANINPVGWVL